MSDFDSFVPEIWGGPECTVNRVRDQYFDQLEMNGHSDRLDDLDRFASSGIKAIRYPFLWERIAPRGVSLADWSWSDERLTKLRELGLRPIAGLLHHGSGPSYTSLLDLGFADKFTEYAAAFTDRYPWIEDYTPINEPLTTARFSCLYGHWFPHARDNWSFFRAVIDQCRATVLAMKAIRKIQPKARLIQTDDLGKASSTPLLKYQADLENERRWLAWDLMVGKVTPDHPFWSIMTAEGIAEEELQFFIEQPCRPDVIGVNHYPLSNRYLDEHLERYPIWCHGGNGKHVYADIEAVRVQDAQFISPEEIFREAWDRYGIPIAVTEVHIMGGREEQMRWFMEAWNAAKKLTQEGVKIEAVTSWGLLGHFDWNTLVTQINGFYESGAFDLRAPSPRPTQLTKMLKSLSEVGKFEHPILEVPGWWRRESRLFYPKETLKSSELGTFGKLGREKSPILITGGEGKLAQTFARACEERGLPYRLTSRSELDISDPKMIASVLGEVRPWAVINAAGYGKVNGAEKETHRCYRDNVQGAENLARFCADHRTRFLTFSSHLVFDGLASTPYLENSPVGPLNIYGKSKVEAERRVSRVYSDSLIVRTGTFFGAVGKDDLFTQMLADLNQKKTFRAANDVKISPTYVPDLVGVCLDLMIDDEKGTWHLSNEGEVSWYDLAVEGAKASGQDWTQILSTPYMELGLHAKRPTYSALASQRGALLPKLENALARFFDRFH